MSKVEALVTPSVMKWAREQSRLDVSTAAKMIGRSAEEIEQWEQGTARPTIAQARKASEVYKRSLAVFYLPEPPQGFDTLRDFRRLPDDSPSGYSPKLALLVRRIQAKQAWLRELLEEEKAPALSFVGSCSMDAPPEDIARAIRETLGITLEMQKECKNRHEALNLWIDRAERAGVFVCRESGIELTEARGFALVDALAPFVFLNSKDALAAQVFSLAHELAHLWLNLPGISNVKNGWELEQDCRGEATEESRIEVFCNQVASETLLDRGSFRELWLSSDTSLSIKDRIKRVSENIKISEEVIARKLLKDNTITQDKYLELRDDYFQRWKEYSAQEKEKNKNSKGGPSPNLLKVLSNGRAFTLLVIASYYSGSLSGRDASSLLGVKLNNLPKVAERARIALRSSRLVSGGQT